MERISENAMQVAQHLKRHAKVAWVNYAGLEEHPDHRLVQKYLSGKASGLLTFGLKGARGRGAAAWRALPRCARVVHSFGEYRRRSLSGNPSGLDHAPAIVPGGTREGGCFGGYRALVDRHRGSEGSQWRIWTPRWRRSNALRRFRTASRISHSNIQVPLHSDI
jgi:hypothetical protein